MTSYSNVTIKNARSIIDSESSIIIDIRDEHNYLQGHIPRAVRLDEQQLIRMRKTPQRHCPVLIYCYHGISSKEIASLLCALGFTDVYNLDGGYTAWQAEQQKVIEANSTIATKNPELRFWLSNQGFDPNNIDARNQTGLTPLMQACRMGLAETTRQLLQSGADVNLTNDDGNNALWLACFSGDAATIGVLIENGVDINNKNITGATALIYASSAGKATVVKQLLDSGANPFVRTQDDFTAQDLAASPQTYHLFRKLRPTA